MTKIGHKSETFTGGHVLKSGTSDIADVLLVATIPTNLRKVYITWANMATARRVELRTTSLSGDIYFYHWVFGSGSAEIDLDMHFPAGVYLTGLASDGGDGITVSIHYDAAADEFKRFSNDDSGSFR